MQYGYKNAEFDADFESVEKVAKKRTRKKLPTKKEAEKIEVSTFITVCKSFWPTTFCGFCALFSADSNLTSNLAFYDIHIEFDKKMFAYIFTFC